MSAIAKSMSLSTFNRSSVVVMLCVLGAVLALFFLPEIIDLQRAVSGHGSAAKVAAAPSVEAPAAGAESYVERGVSLRSVSAPSPLESVLELLDESQEPRARADMGPLVKSSAEGETPREDTEAPRAGVATSDAIEVLSQAPLTWAAIQSEPSRVALRGARSDALDLAQSLGARNRNTRYALFNFANGLGLALDQKAARMMKPEEMVNYLERLDLTVSRTMSRESIDRSDYLKWANISLGPVFEATRLGHRNVNYNVPFNPQLTLTSVFVMHRRPDSMKRGKKENVWVKATGFVRGKDVKRIVVVDDEGIPRRKITPRKADGDSDYRFFQLPNLDGRRDWTIVVEGIGDDSYTKKYRFYSRAVQFPWTRVPGLPMSGYELPFRNVLARPGEFSPRAVDPRLDSFFALGQADAASNLIFATF